MLARRITSGKENPERVSERFGIASMPRPSGKLIWIHAASVGETISVLPVIHMLAGRASVLLTTGTLTSASIAAERLPAHAIHQFVPLDVPGWVTAFLEHWQPDCAVFVEGELWPVTLRLIDALGIPRIFVNASMSERSARRWARFPRFADSLIFGFRWVHVQSDADAHHLSRLGAVGILRWGNLKFAAQLLPADEAELRVMQRAMPGPVWLAASTHAGEEKIIIEAHLRLKEKFPDLISVIVPRHPARGAEFSFRRRSQNHQPRPGEIYMADTLGELGLFFRLAPFVFMGGSLVDIGGHNISEPARLGIPILTGPFTEGIPELIGILKKSDAIVEVTDAESLTEAVRYWLNQPELARAAGARAAMAFSGLETLPTKLADLIMDTCL
jgi:3-deoxy-D-manno-octulosonic-acid transferase